MPPTDPEGLPVVEPSGTPAPPCRHLRYKGMYVYTDGSDPDAESGADDGYDSHIYWCLQTMKDFGPDDELVNRGECRNPSRPCYEEL